MRVFKIVGGGFAVLVLVVLAVVAETHLEMLGLDSELPTFDALAELRQAAGGPVRVRYVNTSSQVGGLATLGHVSVVLEWDDGRTFLIDAPVGGGGKTPPEGPSGIELQLG